MPENKYTTLVQNRFLHLYDPKDKGLENSDCDCSGGDCACSVSEMAYDIGLQINDLDISEIENYKRSPLSRNISLSDEYTLCYGPFHELMVINKAGYELLNNIDSSVFHKIQIGDFESQQTIKNFINHRLLTNKYQPLPVIQEDPLSLTTWLHITDRCNLRCSYCYLPHVREDMSIVTGRASVDAIFRSALANGFNRIKLKYAGGEPLLRFSMIEELHQYAQTIADQRGISLEGVVLSNGTMLTKEIINSMKLHRLRLMISLDGMGGNHDMHRPYAGGRGSFDDVTTAVNLAVENDLTPNISVTVSGRTAESLPQLIPWILERDLPFSLNFYRENELSASNNDLHLDEQKIISGMLAAFKVIENILPPRSLLPSLVDRANLSAPHLHTCGVGQNYLVFDQNGQVAKCQMHIRKPITNIYVEDPLKVIRADQTGLQNLSVEEKEGCRTCEWKYWCAGGCSLATHRATGRYDVKSPNCNIYKALYPEAVRLEGLRLLKYANDPELVLQ